MHEFKEQNRHILFILPNVNILHLICRSGLIIRIYFFYDSEFDMEILQFQNILQYSWVAVVVAVAAALYPLVPLAATQVICDASPSPSVAHQTLNLAPCFTTFSCFPQNGPSAVCFCLPLLLAPCGFQSNASFGCFLRTWLTHRHFLVPISHITGFPPVAYHSSALLIILSHLMSIILYNHRSKNFLIYLL
jgi:hypothetical protein